MEELGLRGGRDLRSTLKPSGPGGSLDGKPKGFLTRLGTEFGDHLKYTLKDFRKECNYFSLSLPAKVSSGSQCGLEIRLDE